MAQAAEKSSLFSFLSHEDERAVLVLAKKEIGTTSYCNWDDDKSQDELLFYEYVDKQFAKYEKPNPDWDDAQDPWSQGWDDGITVSIASEVAWQAFDTSSDEDCPATTGDLLERTEDELEAKQNERKRAIVFGELDTIDESALRFLEGKKESLYLIYRNWVHETASMLTILQAFQAYTQISRLSKGRWNGLVFREAKTHKVLDTNQERTEKLDVPRWLNKHGVSILGQEEAEGVTRWYIDCPNKEKHTTPNAAKDCCITQEPNGKLGGHCFHQSCGMGSWSDLRDAIGTLEHSDYHDESRKSQPKKDEPKTTIHGNATESQILSIYKPKGNSLPDFPPCPPGFIAKVVEHNLATARRKQPLFAMMGAIALQAVLCCRRVRSEYGARPNLSIVCLADTTGGKQHARDINTQILAKSHSDSLIIGNDFTCDIALYRAIEETGSGLSQVDEFGRVLAAGAKGDSQQFKIVTAMMQLATSENDAAFKPKRYADATKNIVLRHPCLCLYGTGTLEAFYTSCSQASLSDGFLGRLLIVHGDSKVPNVMQPDLELPAEIIETAKYWHQLHGNLPDVKQGTVEPKERRVEISDGAKKLLDGFIKESDSLSFRGKEFALWGRAVEKASKLALVYACSANPFEPKIDDDAMAWGVDLVRAITSRTVQETSRWVSGSKFESDCNELLRVIWEQPGHAIARERLSQVYRKLNVRDKRAAIEGLMEQGRVILEKVETKGRPKETYRAVPPS
jgi:hypothetical protein